MEPLNYALFCDPWYHLSYPMVTPILPTWMAKDLEISVARVGRRATNKEWKMWCPKGKPANDRPLFAKLGKKHSNFWLTTGQYMMTWATCSMRFTLPQSIPYKCLQNMRQSFTLSQLPNDRAESQSNVWDRHELHNYPSIINDTITLFPFAGLNSCWRLTARTWK